MQEETTISRRSLVSGTIALGASMFLIGGAIVTNSGEAVAATDAGANDGVQYGFLMNLSNCVDCGSCVEACRSKNGLTEDTPDRRRISSFIDKKRKPVYISTSCMHCAQPSCAEVCPAGAITKGAGGIVSVNQVACIGCKYCYQACPYEVPRYNKISMDKCDCCLGSGVQPGETPNCVRACRFHALNYGKVEDLLSMATAQGAKQISDINDPSAYVV